MTPQTSSSPAAPARTLLGHPLGLYVCFFVEMFERFSFYGMKALLFFYLTKYHLFSDANGYLLLGTYAGLAYALPVVGGMLADRYLGMRKAVLFGGVLLCLGHFGMAFEGHAARQVAGGEVVRDTVALQIFYASLAFIIMGVGFLKPNISTIVGRLYAENDPRRDSGFTLFYMGINLGAAISAFVCGYLGETLGWGYGFGAAGVGMVMGLVAFVAGRKHLLERAEPPRPEALKEKVAGLPREAVIYLGALLGCAFIWQILQTRFDFSAIGALLGMGAGHEITATEVVAVVLTLGLGVYLVRFMLKDCTSQERGRMTALLVLIAISAVFWGLYEQSYGSWNAFSDRVMNRQILGREVTASQLTGLPAIFIILLSFPFAWLWPALDRRGLNPSSSAKFGLALLCSGAAMFILAYSAVNPEANGKAALGWFVLAYLVLVLGEMALSPIGLSAVTTLSVPRVVSLMMGVWFLASAFGEMLAGRFGTLAALEANATVPEALAKYAQVFGLLGWIGLGAGVLMLVLTPVLKRLEGHDPAARRAKAEEKSAPAV